MSNIVDLHGQLAHLEDDELIEDFAQIRRGHVVRRAGEITPSPQQRRLAAMGENDKLVENVEACKLRRIRTGATKRERAQIEIVDAPPILGKIMRTPTPTNGTGLIQSKHLMRLPAPEPRSQQQGHVSK